MRLIIPLIIVILGVLTGALVCWLFKKTATALKLSMAAGGFGAFAGLILNNAMDVSTGSAQGDTLLAVIVGAVVFSVVTNLLIGKAE